MTGARVEPPPDGGDLFVLCSDEAGRIERWNEALERISGFAESEMLGRDARAIVPHSGEVALPLKGGGHRLARWTVSRGNESTRSRRFFALGTDVAEERRARRHQVFAERAAAVARLSSGLAHELRNPLNAALLELEVIRGRVERGVSDPPTLLPLLATLELEVRRVERLVKDLLDIARPEPPKLEPVDLNELLRPLALRVGARAERLGVTLESELDPEVGAVELDARRIREAVLILLDNALEAVDGSGRIWLRTRAAGADGTVSVEVEDSGAGFPHDAPIFDAFYTTKEARPGLGLAIVQRSAADHGGFVRAFRHGERTRFVLALPQPRR